MPSDREPKTIVVRRAPGTDAARSLVVTGFAFGSFARVCLLISTHLGVLAAIAFYLTNRGRRISFGTSQFFGARADLVGALFVLVALTLFVTVGAMLAYAPIHATLRYTGGMRVKVSTREPAAGDPSSP